MLEEVKNQSETSGSGAAGAIPPHQGAGDNVLVRPEPGPENTSQKQPETPPEIYDARAKNPLTFTYYGGDEEVDVLFVFDPLSDERYLQFVKGIDVHGRADDVKERSREEGAALWNDLVNSVENVDYPAGSDWKSLIDSTDKVESLNNFLAVSARKEAKVSDGKLQLGAATDKQVVVTECWFKGKIVEQRHTLQKASFELEKKYDRIRRKTLKETPVRGLMKRSNEVRYVPQEEAFAAMYDEMLVSAEGFADGVIPIRFKTQVLNFIFAPKVAQKDLGK